MFHPLLFLKKLPLNPVFNLFSAAIVLLSGAPLFATPLFDLSLAAQASLVSLERFILLFFAAEALIRAARFPSLREYVTSSLFWIDVFSLLPPLALLFWNLEDPLPGDIILRGGRLLRLIPLYQFFSRERSFGLRPTGSQMEFRLLNSSALLLYLFLLFGGVAMSSIHDRLNSEERSSRLLRIKRYLDTQGLSGVQELFPDRILKIEKRTPGESYELYLADQGYIQTHMQIHRDFLYVEGSTPEEAVLLSFFDLNRRQIQFEASLLATGLLMIAALSIFFHIYFRERILLPVERARRVMELRILGEEIESTDLPAGLENEITELIDAVDQFYNVIRERSDAEPDQQRRTT